MQYCRSDNNQAEIVKALREAVGGPAVKVVSHLKIGCDVMVSAFGRITFLEIKDPKRKKRLTSNEVEFQRYFPVITVTTVKEALAAVIR